MIHRTGTDHTSPLLLSTHASLPVQLLSLHTHSPLLCSNDSESKQTPHCVLLYANSGAFYRCYSIQAVSDVADLSLTLTTLAGVADLYVAEVDVASAKSGSDAPKLPSPADPASYNYTTQGQTGNCCLKRKVEFEPMDNSFQPPLAAAHYCHV